MQRAFKSSIWEFAESFWCTWGWALQRQGVSRGEEGNGGGLSSGGLWEKHTSSYTSDSNQFQSRAERNFCTNEPKVPRLEKNKYTEVERGNNQPLKKNFRFQLANKKAKQSIMSESPHSWPLLPGSGRMRSDKTRICKLICGRLGRGGGGDGGGGGGSGLWKDKWAFQGTTPGPVKSLLSQTLINHRSGGY